VFPGCVQYAPGYYGAYQPNGGRHTRKNGQARSCRIGRIPVYCMYVHFSSERNIDVAMAVLTNQGLMELETTIANGFSKFLEVGNALLEIQTRKLYLDDDYVTFEQYCAKRWSISRSQAYRMIQAAEVVGHLAEDHNLPLPIHEAQTRVLAKLKEPQAIRAVWEEVVDEYGETVLERIRTAIPPGCSASAGIAYWNGAETAESLLARADAALYEAKRSGRNTAVRAGSTFIDGARDVA